jgi:hypothetical protein
MYNHNLLDLAAATTGGERVVEETGEGTNSSAF